MTKPRTDTRTASERVNDLPRILQAMRLAVREALVEHKAARNRVAAWRDDRVVWIQPDDLRIDEEEP